MPVNNTTKVFILIVLAFYFVLVGIFYVGYGNFMYDKEDTVDSIHNANYESGVGLVDKQIDKITFLDYFIFSVSEFPAWANILAFGIPFGISLYIFISMFFGGGGG